MGKIMLSEKLFDATSLPLLRKGMDAYSIRHRAIADNVANAETHGYKRKEVRFESKLKEVLRTRELRTTHSRHIGTSGSELADMDPKVKLDQRPSDTNDISNVDIDREMADMAKNKLQFFFASNMARRFYELINTSVRGI